jgi:hypothetical protein
MPNIPALLATSALLAVAPLAAAQSDVGLARYFGFLESRVIVVDDNPGPALAADVDGDGRTDLVVANNRKSRLEVFRQRETRRSDEEMERSFRVNELPPNPWFDREQISVPHQVTAFRMADLDDDGDLDLLYAGQPAEIVALEQVSPMIFEQASRLRVRGLNPGQDGFEVADVRGDAAPELLTLVGGRVHVYDLEGLRVTGEPDRLGSGGDLVAFFVEDYDGDARQDVLGVIPDNDAPVRLWVQGGDPGAGVVGPELRFEMPPLIEIEPVRFPDRAAASIGVIERTSRRIVLYDLLSETIEDVLETGVASVERDAPVEIHALPGGNQGSRGIIAADIDLDGLSDLLVTDQQTNSLHLYRQTRGGGVAGGEPFSSFKEPKTIAAGQWDGEGPLEVFVLSEEEKTFGVSTYSRATGRLSFPRPISAATQGATPVAMSFSEWGGSPALVVVMKDRRDHTLEIHRPGMDPITKELEGVNRPPESIRPGDYDHDGTTDFLLFSPDEPMVMVRTVGGDDPLAVLTDDDMPQYGLVQKAGPGNTGSLDIDGDGAPELLIADENFVRACAFDPGEGWRVVEQVTLNDATTNLVGLDVLSTPAGDRIVASDRGEDRLVVMAPGEDGAWGVGAKLRLSGFDIGGVLAGSFSGDGEPNILCPSGDSFALVRLAGERASLEEFAAYRSDDEDRLEHEMEVGDINSDGYVDLVVLDAREQMCQIFTLSASRRLHFATEFKVFESRLFQRGDSRSFQPSAAIIADLTGDGRADLTLEVHDRYLMLPQMAAPR